MDEPKIRVLLVVLQILDRKGNDEVMHYVSCSKHLCDWGKKKQSDEESLELKGAPQE